MSRSYTTLARAWDELYGTFVDYRAEFRSWHARLARVGARRVLEVGCGAGNLANAFVEAGYDYTGLDVSRPFLALARRRAPRARFVAGDMRRFASPRRQDAVIVTGRTVTHLPTNADVLAALRCFRRALVPGGMLAFDAFDARAVFTNPRRRFEQRAVVGPRAYRRVMVNRMAYDRGWTWSWRSTWTIREAGRTRRERDHDVLRAYTPDELALLLELGGFERVRTTRRGAVLTTVAYRGAGAR